MSGYTQATGITDAQLLATPWHVSSPRPNILLGGPPRKHSGWAILDVRGGLIAKNLTKFDAERICLAVNEKYPGGQP